MSPSITYLLWFVSNMASCVIWIWGSQPRVSSLRATRKDSKPLLNPRLYLQWLVLTSKFGTSACSEPCHQQVQNIEQKATNTPYFLPLGSWWCHSSTEACDGIWGSRARNKPRFTTNCSKLLIVWNLTKVSPNKLQLLINVVFVMSWNSLTFVLLYQQPYAAISSLKHLPIKSLRALVSGCTFFHRKKPYGA